MEFIKALWNYVLIISPYLFLGLLASGLVYSFVSFEKIKKLLGGKKFSGIINASLLGVPLPVCSCSVIPMAVTLKKAGASNASTSAFLITGPETGVDSITLTYALMDLPMSIIRPAAAFCSGLMAGWLNLLYNSKTSDEAFFTQVEAAKDSENCCHQDHKHQKTNSDDESNEGPQMVSEKIPWKEKLIKGLKFAFVDLTNDMALWMVLGILCGAAIDFFMPANFFGQLGPTTARLSILLVGIPMYICASGATPIAASLMLKGMSPGTALLFLLVGPATNFSTFIVLQKYIGKKGVLLNLLSIAVVALIFSYLTDWLYQHFSWGQGTKFFSHKHGMESGPAWYTNLLGIFISLLLLNGIYQEEIKGRLQRKGVSTT